MISTGKMFVSLKSGREKKECNDRGGGNAKARIISSPKLLIINCAR